MGRGRIVLLIVAVLLVFLVVISGVSWGWQYFTATFRGEVEKTELIAGSGEFQIYSYNHFFDLCAAVQQAEAQYDAQYGLLQSMQSGTERYERQQRVVAVQLAHIEQLKRQYNVDAAKEETVAAFKSNNLPNHLDTRVHEQGKRTRCTYQD